MAESFEERIRRKTAARLREAVTQPEPAAPVQEINDIALLSPDQYLLANQPAQEPPLEPYRPRMVEEFMSEPGLRPGVDEDILLGAIFPAFVFGPALGAIGGKVGRFAAKIGKKVGGKIGGTIEKVGARLRGVEAALPEEALITGQPTAAYTPPTRLVLRAKVRSLLDSRAKEILDPETLASLQKSGISREQVMSLAEDFLYTGKPPAGVDKLPAHARKLVGDLARVDQKKLRIFDLTPEEQATFPQSVMKKAAGEEAIRQRAADLGPNAGPPIARGGKPVPPPDRLLRSSPLEPPTPTPTPPASPTLSTAEDLLLRGGAAVGASLAKQEGGLVRKKGPLDFLQEDISSTVGKLEQALAHVEDVVETGTFQPKSIRPELAKGAAPSKSTLVSAEVNRKANEFFTFAAREVKRLRMLAQEKADDFTATTLRIAEDRLKLAFAKRQEAAAASSAALRQLKEKVIPSDVADIFQQLKSITDIKPKMAALDEIFISVLETMKPGWGRGFSTRKFGDEFRVSDRATLRTGEGALKQAGNLFDLAKINLFPILSFSRDALTNAVAISTKIPGMILNDIYSVGTGQTPKELGSLILGLSRTAKYPFNKTTMKLPEFLEQELGNEIRDATITHATRLKVGKLPLDYLAAPALRLKVAVDRFTSRSMSLASLIRQGTEQAEAKGLQGVAKSEFISRFVANPSQEAAKEAIRIGKIFKYNVDQTYIEKRVQGSRVFQIVGDTFPRWGFQFTRWMGRTLGADPHFYKRLVSGSVTRREVIDYLATTATGVGGLMLMNEFYDNVDHQSAEYVDPATLERTRLGGLSPAPEAFFMLAVIKGDGRKAMGILPYTSIPFAGLAAGSPKGYLSDFLKSVQQYLKGSISEDRFLQEANKQIRAIIPGKALLSAVESMLDPVARKGPLSDIPLLSRTQRPVIDLTTGRPLEAIQRVGGFEFPAAGGVSIPGGTRVQTPLQRILLDYKIGLFRAGRTPIGEFPAPGVPRELQQEFEMLFGAYMEKLGNELIDRPAFLKNDQIRRDKSRSLEDRVMAFDLNHEQLEYIMQQAQNLALAILDNRTGKVFLRTNVPSEVLMGREATSLGRKKLEVESRKFPGGLP